VATKLLPLWFGPEESRPSLRKLILAYADRYLLSKPFALERGSDSDDNPLMHSLRNLAIKPSDVCANYCAALKFIDFRLVSRVGIHLPDKLRFAPNVALQPFPNQVQMHLYMQSEALVRECVRRGIAVIGQGGRLPVLNDPRRRGRRSK
jgi:diketogulonate reductase-like aldo/keto reductase